MRRRKIFGIDAFEVVVQVIITCVIAGLASEVSYGRVGDMIVGGTFVSSLLVLAWRRKRALKSDPEAQGGMERMEELEYRVADLESTQQRVLELEERLDFAERLLARQRESESLPEGR